MKKAKLFLVCLSFILLAGCDSSNSIDFISTLSLYGKQMLHSQIASNHAYKAGAYAGSIRFDSKLTFDEVFDFVREHDENILSAEKFGKHIFIVKEGLLKGTKDYCVISTAEKTTKENRYIFHDSSVEFIYDVTDNDSKYSELLFPMQYFDYAGFYDDIRTIYAKQDYYVTKGPDEFYEYYQNYGWFDLERDENGITILGFKDNLEPNDADLKLPGLIRMTFSGQGNSYRLDVEAIKH